MSGIGFRPDIQGLRALAVAAVIAFHAGVPIASGGFAGVDVFFVISGFLITGLMLRERERDSSPRQLADFYARRARRIIPAATVVILATLALAVLTQNGLVRVWMAKDAIASALFYANVHFVDEVGALSISTPSPLGHYWSLAVEEQFYVVWPLLFLGVCAVAGRQRRPALFATVAALSVASFVTAQLWLDEADNGVYNASRAFCLLPPRAWQLGVGALLAIGAPALGSLPALARKALQCGGVAAIGAAFLLIESTKGFPAFPALLPTFGAAALIAAGVGAAAGGLVDRVLASRPFQLGGRYSYSMYLWHLPLYALVVHPNVSGWAPRTAVLAVMTIGAAVVTYHVVEEPIRDAPALRLRSAFRSVAVGAACIAVTLIGATVVSEHGEATVKRNARNARTTAVTSAGETPQSPQVPADAAASPASLQPAAGIAAALVPALLDAKTRRYRAPRTTSPLPAAAPTIALVGDSHAEHLLPAFDQAAAALGAHLVTHTLRGCPEFAPANPAIRSVCDDTKKDTLVQLRSGPPTLIVLSTAGVDGPVDDAAGFNARASEVLARYRAIAPVLVVSFTPVARRDAPTCLANNLQSTQNCALPWPVEANAELGRVAAASDAGFVDLRPVLCAETTCPPIIDDQLVYSDTQHFTATFAATLGPWFTEQLRAALGTP